MSKHLYNNFVNLVKFPNKMFKLYGRPILQQKNHFPYKSIVCSLLNIKTVLLCILFNLYYYFFNYTYFCLTKLFKLVQESIKSICSIISYHGILDGSFECNAYVCGSSGLEVM